MVDGRVRDVVDGWLVDFNVESVRVFVDAGQSRRAPELHDVVRLARVQLVLSVLLQVLPQPISWQVEQGAHSLRLVERTVVINDSCQVSPVVRNLTKHR